MQERFPFFAVLKVGGVNPLHLRIKQLMVVVLDEFSQMEQRWLPGSDKTEELALVQGPLSRSNSRSRTGRWVLLNSRSTSRT